MEKHIHKIGVKCDNNLRLYCNVCGKHFEILNAINYLEAYLGMKQGLDYWRRLRHFRDQMRIDKKKGITFEGIWIPE